MLFSSYRKNPIVSCITAAFLLLSAVFTFSGCEAEASSKEEAKLISIEIENEPTKTEFTQGEVLDLSGLTVYALYSDSSKKMILDYSVNPAESSELNTTGKITVTVSYKGKTAKFYITVNEKKETDNTPTLTSIEILSLPEKTEYTEGDCFTSNGLVLQGTYSDGTKENLSGWSTSPRNGVELSETGTETVTVTYGNFSKTFTISVKAKPAIISDSFFWGTWVRMDSGEQYEVLESSVKKIGKNSSTSYKITSVSGDASGASDTSSSRSRTVLPSEMPYITVETLGTFVKESDSVIKNGDIPYFRNGGTNLDYSLKIVGFSNSRAVSSGISGLKGTGKSKNFSTWKSTSESGSDGVLNLKAPTINDVQTVTIETGDSDNSLIVIPDIMVSNTGDYMGTVALVAEDQYNLKISGYVSNKDYSTNIDNGYLFGNNGNRYKMELTITNISENECTSSAIEVLPADSRLKIYSDYELKYGLDLQTIAPGAYQKINFEIEFGEMSQTEPFINTGLNIKITNMTDEVWEDYVPLRFYRGLIPITVSTQSPSKKSTSTLNGFVIYPDGNNQYFSIDNNSSEILFVPTFGKNEKYKMVFSGASTAQNADEGTEMYYSVNPGKSTEKEINLSTELSIRNGWKRYGEPNNSEENEFNAENEFIAYLAAGDIDFYTISADSDEFYAPGAKTFHRVTFESEYGTVPSSFLVAEGNYIPSEKLPILEESGMTFEGWYAGSTPVTGNNYPVYGDVTLKARWNYTEYSVTYELNGGTNASGNPTVFTINTAETTLKAPTRTGYDFKGWYYAEDFKGDGVTKIAGGTTGNLKLYAKWEATKYPVSYVLNGGTAGTGENANPDFYTIEQSVSIKPATRNGYAFAGWFTNASFNGNKISSIEKGSTGSLTLYARWLKRCTVNFVSAHGTVPTSIIKGETDTFAEEELPTLTADGWFFKGWYALDGEGGTVKVEADSYVIQGNLTLTANWAKACTISYNSEKATSDVPTSIVVEKGTVLTEAQLPSLKEKGFRFTGWFIEGTTTKVSVGYSVNSNLNLSAGWEEHYGPEDGFVLVEGGSFQMGQSADGNNSTPVHSVTVSDFYISPYELTQGEYEELCCYRYTSYSPSSSYGYGSQYPVYFVSWYDALVYCNLKSMKEGLTPCYTINGETDPKSWPGIKTNSGKYSSSYTSNDSTWDAATCDFTADGYRLPTEAEWEYATKGGKKSQGYTYSGSNNAGDVAWYSDNSGGKTHQVGTKNKNELDLYDMSGNVFEWCWDWNGSYSSDSDTDPTGAFSGSDRVLRGGGWDLGVSYLPLVYRVSIDPFRRSNDFGFRLVRSTKNRIVPCTISYTNSRGTAPTSVILPKGTALTDSHLPALSSDNYDFTGWYAGSTKVENGYIIDSDTELEARWNPTSYKITYVLNGGSSGSADEAINDAENPASYTIEDSVTLKPATRTGYKFNGWYKNSSLSGYEIPWIKKGNYGEITLYASWIELCTITYSSEKGLAPEAVTVEKGSLLTKNELPIIKSTGFKMTGWFNGSTKVSVGDKITTSLDLTAHWEEHDGPDDDFVFVEGGTFQMGSESGESNEKPVHSVTLSDFYISPYELTQGEYEELCCYTSKTPSSAYGVGSNYPVYYVSWYDALVYCNLKSMQKGLTPCYTISGTTDPKNWPGIKESAGKYSCSYSSSSSEDANIIDTWEAVICNFTVNGYRLPTEAEWEYAARGGKNSKNYTYSGSDSVDDVAWFTPHPVGTKQENELDLYDMSGNIGELCWDWYKDSSYTSDSVIDPTGPSPAIGHVYRGGGWNLTATKMRVTSHLYGGCPNMSSYAGGFRLVRSSKNRIVQCTLSYTTARGNAPDSSVVLKGYTFTSEDLPELTYNDYTFDGWYIDGTKVMAGDIVNSDVVLVARWKDNFVFVEGGTFQMGKSADGNNSTPIHTVTVSDFYISPYELTQGEYEELCCYTSSSPSSSYGYGSQYPVYYVSWYDALVYCNLKSMKEGLTPCYTINGETDPKSWPGIKTNNGKYSSNYASNDSTWNAATCDFTADGYRLPTEAEWEYAAKGGKKSWNYTYSGSNIVDDVGWYTDNSGSKTHQVGTKNKNELDLYDMSGNVWEWCWDWYGSYSSSSATDPTGASSGSYRVERGGSWGLSASILCVAYRNCTSPYYRDYDYGFRLVRSAPKN